MRATLKAKLDADVVSVPAGEQQFCEQVALSFGCEFEMDSLGEVAFIRQCGSTTLKEVRPEYKEKKPPSEARAA